MSDFHDPVLVVGLLVDRLGTGEAERTRAASKMVEPTLTAKVELVFGFGVLRAEIQDDEIALPLRPSSLVNGVSDRYMS